MLPWHLCAQYPLGNYNSPAKQCWPRRNVQKQEGATQVALEAPTPSRHGKRMMRLANNNCMALLRAVHLATLRNEARALNMLRTCATGQDLHDCQCCVRAPPLATDTIAGMRMEVSGTATPVDSNRHAQSIRTLISVHSLILSCTLAFLPKKHTTDTLCCSVRNVAWAATCEPGAHLRLSFSPATACASAGAPG